MITENLNEICAGEFSKLQEILTANGVTFEVDPKLVRGLDYYTKTAFEFVSGEIGSQSAVGGGGRYDNLVAFLGGRPTFGVGFALGIERFMEILSSKESKQKRVGIYICALDKKYIDKIFKIGIDLRRNFKVEISYEAKNLQKHLKNADNKNAEIFLCMGENEAKNDELFMKNLIAKTNKNIKIAEILKEIR